MELLCQNQNYFLSGTYSSDNTSCAVRFYEHQYWILLCVAVIPLYASTFSPPVHATIFNTRLDTCASWLGELHEEDLLANDRSVVVVTAAGYIKRMPLEEFTSQNRC